MKMNNPVLILGAGISGLGAAYKLSCNGQQTVVLEKDTTYGGLCGNFTIDGFRFDRFVHFSFAKDEQVNRIFMDGAGEVFRHVPNAYNLYQGIWIKHPAQNNLYPLSQKMKDAVVRDFSLDAIKLVACIFVCTLHTIGMFMSESSDFHLSYLLFYMSGIAVPLFFMVNGFLLAPKDGGMKYYYRKIFNIVKIVCVFTFIFDIPKLVRGDISILIPFKQACSSLFFQGGVFPVFWFLGSLIFIYALMPFLKKYIISIRTRLYGLLLFLSVLQFIIYTCDIYTNYVYSFIFENVYIPQSFRLYSHLMYFLLGVCLRLYLTDNNMLKNVIGGVKRSCAI